MKAAQEATEKAVAKLVRKLPKLVLWCCWGAKGGAKATGAAAKGATSAASGGCCLVQPLLSRPVERLPLPLVELVPWVVLLQDRAIVAGAKMAAAAKWC